MSKKDFQTQAEMMLGGLVQVTPAAPQEVVVKDEVKETAPVKVQKVTPVAVSEDKITKLMIELPLSESMRINRIVDQRVLNGERYSKKKFLTDAVLEAINKYDK